MNTISLRARIGLIVMGFAGFWSFAEAKVVYVAKTGSDANDGLSWATAKVTVQAGLNAAAAGDEVWVAAGTYVELVSLAGGAALYGGFVGSETDLAQRDWKANLTILDGNQSGSAVSVPAGAGDTSRIDGFTIRNGTGTTTSSSTSIRYGGGIYCASSHATISNNTIMGNTADYGGGIYCYRSSPTISNNTVTGNSGSGIYCYYYSSPMVSNNTVTWNNGSGIYCYYCSFPMISNNTVTGNGGSGIYCSDSSPTIANTLVAFNSSGIYRYGAFTPNLRYNCVYGNTDYNYSGMTDATGTEGNISIDPKLLAADYGQVHLRAGSPCIDAGDDSMVQSGWVDKDGEPRIQGTHVDIGADEYNGTPPSFTPRTVRVSPSGDDANDGSSWERAKRTVQAGIDAAAGPSGGDVWVAAGTYTERITMKLFVHAYGGFAGTETRPEQRDWVNQVTILDGSAGGSVVSVLAGSGVSVVDGFTIRNGKASSGGGVYCYKSFPTISNNTITGNAASSVGGGIYCESSSPRISNNTITGNTAFRFGGGICCKSSSPTIANNAVAGNASLSQASGGGGIFCSGGSPTITNNTIVRNTSIDLGGGIYCADSSPTIVNTLVAFNSSGIHRYGTGTPSLRYNCVYGNVAHNYSGTTDPTGTDGNISTDPQLLAANNGDVHLKAGSPCMDAGDDAVVRPGWVDMDGEPRIQGTHVDIGADEYNGTPPTFTPRGVVRVSPSGDDANDGSSWERAKRTVQAGIDAAAVSSGRDVWVAAGTYPERITMKLFVRVYGGFAGTETRPEQRDWVNQVTILDGSAGGSVVSAPAGSGFSVVDGFTIRNGKTSSGGGIYCYNSFPTISHNTITGNSSDGRFSSDGGGGVFCFGGPPTISNNMITENGAVTSGGGIYCYYSSPTISNNTITGHRLGGYGVKTYGGGIYCYYYSSPTIANNTITGNTAIYGGGICCDYYSSPTIIDTIVAFNSSGIGWYDAGTPRLRYNCVYGNAAYNYNGLADPTGADGNISADPGFVQTPSPGPDGQWATADDEPGDLHLEAGSPCIDAGDNAAVPAGVLTDLDGLLRFVDDPATADTGLGTAPIVDMGVYEYVPGDFDRDGDIDADDLKVFAACVSGPAVHYAGDCAKADFDGDGDVDQSDFGFIQRWFGGAGK